MMTNDVQFSRNDSLRYVLVIKAWLLMTMTVWLVGCAALRPHSPPPQKLEAMVQIPDMPGVRAWGDQFSPVFQQDAIDAKAQERRSGLYVEGGEVNILAISGGGGDGAFGAGMLCGWTASGTRPMFKLVTGVSTGALTAPFAFLGPAYDAKLKKVYTTIKTSDIFMMRSLLAMLYSDAIGLNDPLARLTAEIVDEKMLKDVATEHLKGRRLYISTTALDAQRPVVWNMGAIAASGHPKALELFRKVMIASAAIPVAFPPSYIKVEAGGQRWDEMHVDGGVANQVFLYGPMLDPLKFRRDPTKPARRKGRVFIIRNTQLKPDWQYVAPTMRHIGPRSVSSLIKAQGVGDLYRIFATTERDNLDFNLAFIPDALDTNRDDEFDTRVMNLLFESGYNLAKRGYRWQQAPPGYFRVKKAEDQPDATLEEAPVTAN